MKAARTPSRDVYLEHLGTLPFVQGARLRPREARHGDGQLVLDSGRSHYEFRIEETEIERLNYAILDSRIARLPDSKAMPWILFAPYITADAGGYLRSRHVNYVDRLGNCHVALGTNHIALIEGRRPPKETTPDRRTGGPATYQVFFALLARPDLIRAPIRTIAESAGVSKTLAGGALRRLTENGILGEAGYGRILLDADELQQRWLAVYAEIVRPKLLVGRYMAHEKDPRKLEEILETSPADGPGAIWAYGGAAAGFRLTGHYRGPETVLHVQDDARAIIRHARLVPAREGTVQVYHAPGVVAFDGPKPRVVHPLLVYSELMAHGGSREREAAAEVRTQYLTPAP